MNGAEVKRAAAQIRRVLKEDWDPIGGWTPDDEYDEFVWRLFGMCVDGAAREGIERYLRWATDDYMKCPIPDERTRLTVDKIMALDFNGETQ